MSEDHKPYIPPPFREGHTIICHRLERVQSGSFRGVKKCIDWENKKGQLKTTTMRVIWNDSK